MAGPPLAPNVGGILELHYAHPTLGPVYPMRLAVAAFDHTTFDYTGAGGYSPDETNVADTYRALALLWAPYYDNQWSIELGAVYANTGGLPQPMLTPPATTPVVGTCPTLVPGGSACKRSITFLSTRNQAWRIWLRQLPILGVGETVDVYSNTGGIDNKDRGWFGYFLNINSGVVNRDGFPMQSAGKARGWWDTPPAPYVVSG